MKYDCPVCGYDKLDESPADWMICPCCRTEFGYSDANRNYDELRVAWIKEGAFWLSKRVKKPLGWLANEQLWRAGLVSDSIASDPSWRLDFDSAWQPSVLNSVGVGNSSVVASGASMVFVLLSALRRPDTLTGFGAIPMQLNYA